jgi:hypothetical protein
VLSVRERNLLSLAPKDPNFSDRSWRSRMNWIGAQPMHSLHLLAGEPLTTERLTDQTYIFIMYAFAYGLSLAPGNCQTKSSNA